jgi:hypothetical protein
MKQFRHRLVAALSALLMFYGTLAFAASLPTIPGPYDPSNLGLYLNTVISEVNSNVPGFGGRNYLDNGAAFVTQRGTGEATGSSTAGCAVTAYVADRWCIDTNVTSGAGFGQVVTSSPTPPVGFQNSIKVYRKTGALTQPVCLMQEIEGARFIQLQGKQVIISAWIAALAGAPAGMTVTGSLITGTVVDEGLGALRSAVGMTASPAITPALTGVATAAATLSAVPTATFARFGSGQITVPVGAKEGVVVFCFTPGAETAGTTDGFAITGMQLEAVDPLQTAAGAFEVLPLAVDLQRAQRFYYQVVEVANVYVAPGIASATNVQTVTLPLPVPMSILPVMAFTAGGFSYRDNGSALAVSSPALTAGSLATTTGMLTITDSATQTVGHTAPLYGTTTTGKITLSADF